jgi:hypothetical protein
MLEQIARRLRAAMAGLGTDEEAIYASFAGRTEEQLFAISETYKRLFPGRDLYVDVQDELNEDELARLNQLAPTPGSETVSLADRVARELDKAMDRLGTDESAIFAALTGRTATELKDIKDAYKNLTKRELEADLRDELSGADWIEAVRLLHQGVLQPEDEIYLAIKGLGTDEERIFRTLEGMRGNTAAIEDLDRKYRTKYGDLIEDLRGDLSGADYERAIAVLKPVIQDVGFEDCAQADIDRTRKTIGTAIQRVDHAIQVLRKGWSAMSQPEKDVFNQFFDPGGKGFDARFVGDVLNNFRLIHSDLNTDYAIVCETNTCSYLGYYWWPQSHVHVCPPFLTSTDEELRIVTIIHETAHKALLALDRTDFNANPGASNAEYKKMTPRGPFGTGIPVIGRLIVMIARSDTLYAPDAYGYFAARVP